MREQIRRLRSRLLEKYSGYEHRLRSDKLIQQAAISFLRRSQSLDEAIFVLLERNLVPEAGILLRSQINLSWLFPFMIDAKIQQDRFEFDDDPPRDSAASRRAARYLSWHWVDSHRRSPSPKTKEMFQRFRREHGFQSESEVPRFWYQETDTQTIKNLAERVGGLRQYEQDYSHLSGIEHTDITATIVQQLPNERYKDFIAFKSSYVLAMVQDITIKICGCEATKETVDVMKGFDALAKEISRSLEASSQDA